MAKRPKQTVPAYVAPGDTATVPDVKPQIGDVKWKRPELVEREPLYETIADVIEGEDAVKKRGVPYLPLPLVSADPKADEARYEGYRARAIFYNVTGYTLIGLVGLVFIKPPTVNLPKQLDAVHKDADGDGNTLESLAEQLVTWNSSYGRCGLWVDYPETGGSVSQKQILDGEVRPYLKKFGPLDITNWHETSINNRKMATLVVLREWFDFADNEFKSTRRERFYVLRLKKGESGGYFYTKQIVEDDANDMKVYEEVMPLQGDGKPLTEIPFKIIGAIKNTFEFDPAPLGTMARLNIGHYRNSADYEDSVFMVGQPTPWFAGLTNAWMDQYYKDHTVYLGSRGAVMLPEGGSAGLLQADPNTLVNDAMVRKEEQMISIGAKLVERQSGGQKTATETNKETAAETSALKKSADNVSAAMEWCLEYAAIFQNVTNVRADAKDAENKVVRFEINTEYAMMTLSPEQISAVIKAWVQEAITTREMRKRLTSNGLAFEDEEAFTQWAQEQKDAALEAEKASAAIGGGGFNGGE